MYDSVCSVWGHSVHFGKFPILRFSKGYSSPSFHPISTFAESMYLEKMHSITFSGDLPNFESIWHLKISYLSCIAIIHKAVLVSSEKRSSSASRPLDLFF